MRAAAVMLLARPNGRLHFVSNIPQHFCPALQISGAGTIESDRHITSDQVNGVVPPVEINREDTLPFIVGNTGNTGNSAGAPRGHLFPVFPVFPVRHSDIS